MRTLLMAALVTALAPGGDALEPLPTGECALESASSDAIPSASCVACHHGFSSHSHPVGMDYAAAAAASRGSLRPLEGVVGRGVFLPNGSVECTTCHDARSPWASHIALPPGAVPSAAVDPRKPETYEGRRSWRVASRAESLLLQRGAAVTAAPLCAACHAVAD